MTLPHGGSGGNRTRVQNQFPTALTCLLDARGRIGYRQFARYHSAAFLLHLVESNTSKEWNPGDLGRVHPRCPRKTWGVTYCDNQNVNASTTASIRDADLLVFVFCLRRLFRLRCFVDRRLFGFRRLLFGIAHVASPFRFQFPARVRFRVNPLYRLLIGIASENY